MHLYYNGVQLQLERTSAVDITPVMDASGMDFLYRKITVSMICVWNPLATCSNAGGFIPPGARLVNNIPTKPTINPIPNTALPGDRLGLSLANLQETLMVPQRPLRIWIAQDRVWDVPITFLDDAAAAGVGPIPRQGQPGAVFGNANFIQAACDPGGGPFPEDCKILQIIGDKSAIIQYRITFHDTDCDNYVLSNRWRVTSHVNADWTTTRVTEGRAVFRLDKLTFDGFVADQFRQELVIGVPNGFIRKSVNVTATEDGREIHYQIVDRELHLNLGTNNAAIQVDGHVTTGAAVPYHTVFEATMAGAAAATNIALDVAKLDFYSAMEKAAKILPRPRAMAVIRVTGPKSCNRVLLAQTAVAVAIDRLTPIFFGGAQYFFRSAYMIQNVSTESPPTMEIHLEVLTGALNMLSSLINAMNIPNTQKTTNTIVNGAGATLLTDNITSGNPRFPGNNQLNPAQNVGSRGYWIGMAVTQIFKDPTGQCSGVPIGPTAETSGVQAATYKEVAGPDNPSNTTLD